MPGKIVKGQERVAVIRAVSERKAERKVLLRSAVKNYCSLTDRVFTQTVNEVVSGPATEKRKLPDCGVRRTTPGVDEYGRNRGKKKPEGRRSTDLAPEVSSDAEQLAIRVQAEEED